MPAVDGEGGVGHLDLRQGKGQTPRLDVPSDFGYSQGRWLAGTPQVEGGDGPANFEE